MTASSHLLDNRTGGVGESIASRNEVVTHSASPARRSFHERRSKCCSQQARDNICSIKTSFEDGARGFSCNNSVELRVCAIRGRRSGNGYGHTWDAGLRLVDEKKNKSYSLEPGCVEVKAGDRVQLKGKKSSGTAGAEMFEPTKVVKNFGSCGAEATH